MEVSVPPDPCDHCMANISNDSHSNGCIVAFHCSFNLISLLWPPTVF